MAGQRLDETDLVRVLIVLRCACALKLRVEEKVRALHHCAYNANVPVRRTVLRF